MFLKQINEWTEQLFLFVNSHTGIWRAKANQITPSRLVSMKPEIYSFEIGSL